MQVFVALSSEAPTLLAQLRKSMEMDAGPPTTQARCFPYVAGVKECGCAPIPLPVSIVAFSFACMHVESII